MPYSCINCGMKQEGDFENGFDPKLCLKCGEALEQGKLAPEQVLALRGKGIPRSHQLYDRYDDDGHPKPRSREP